MLFNTITFLLFFIIFFITYWLFKEKHFKYQNLFLLIASYIFYGWWDTRFLSLIILSTLVDYVVGIQIYKSVSLKHKKLYLYISLIFNLGLLGFFKYYNFFISSLQESITALGFSIDTWTLTIILPVGISFYTFQTLSYSIDVYRGELKPTKDFISFAAFVTFFPQLVAGPIERASHLLPQFLSPRKFSFQDARIGINLITYGLFKKVVVADRLALYVNNIFNDIGNANTISLLIGIVFFSLQIYCDFSGYSLMARGLSKLLGFDLMVNFKRPYLATSIPDFWRRWHVSLSTWFRDYVYIPLGGNRVSTFKIYLNLFIVFLISGLWHGANWTFIVWGALHGIFQVIYLVYKKATYSNNTVLQKKNDRFLLKFFKILLVYSLVCFAWIFFRSQTIEEAVYFISKILEFDFSINLAQLSAFKGPLNLLLSFFAILILLLSYLLPENLNFKRNSDYLLFNFVIILLIILLGVNGKAGFIYFQF